MPNSEDPLKEPIRGKVFNPDPVIRFSSRLDDTIKDVRERGERRRERWGVIGIESMTRLACSFPSLRSAAGVEPWDPLALLRWSLPASHGEACAAKFVLSVWNSSTNNELIEPDRKFSRFDLFEAMNVWDQEHINAALAWIELPFSP